MFPSAAAQQGNIKREVHVKLSLMKPQMRSDAHLNILDRTETVGEMIHHENLCKCFCGTWTVADVL